MNAPLPESIRKALENVTLDDKYSLASGRAFMSGVQALVRLPMLQKKRDAIAGLNTAGFISGYRGSPLGGYDQSLWQAKKHLAAQDIVFQPGVNEELAATAVWGSQMLDLYPQSRKFDGVFGIWYGKGPGVDRCSDVFKHANMAGTSQHGGVIALAGDDHIAKSSTAAHQSDHIFKACGLPVFFPSSVQDILDMGLHAFAMSRFAGVWSGMKTIQEVVESSASIFVDPDRVEIVLPGDFEMPAGGVHVRWPDGALEQEARLMDFKWYAALAYIRANRLNHNVIEGPNDRFGIMASGKAYNDTRQALNDLGLDDDACRRLGIRLHKVNVVWPLEATITRDFARGLEEILVVEEKRQVIEYQVKEELYNWRSDVRPNVLGKFDEPSGDGSGGEWSQPNPSQNWLLRAQADLNPSLIAKALAKRLKKLGGGQGLDRDTVARIDARVALIEAKERSLSSVVLSGPDSAGERTPFFCSGCPHNTSTRVPEGSRAVAGIGCHYMAVWMDRSTVTFSQMGGEGVSWVGQAPFTTDKHIFANLGDGTYYHSGLLAVRQSIAAKVNITYKILFNDAVAMTGGQPIDGTLKVPEMTRELDAEGATRIVVVTDEPEKYDEAEIAARLAPGVTVHHRDDLDRIQRELREIPGCTVIVYDQTCATEKRRRRKRGTMVEPAKRVVINELVCEGCGDCSVQSNCLSVEPVETEFGRKRRINQNTCNKDYSCVKGFCPELRHRRRRTAEERGEEGRAGTARSVHPRAAARADAAAGRNTLGHRRRRGRRNRRHHDRPAARHGRPSRRQGHRHPGLGRTGAKGWRDVEPYPDRQSPGRHLHDQGRHRRGRSGDRLRSDRDGQQGNARGDARRPHVRRDEHPCHADRGLRLRPRLAVPGRQLRRRRRRRGRGGRARRLRRRSPGGAARRRLALHQPPAARLRVAEGQGPAEPGGAAALDRTQRRPGREQQARLRMGPAGRA